MPIAIQTPAKTENGYENTPFAEQLDFFRRKLALPSDAWDDIWKAAHDRAFIVAGAAQADLVNDLHRAMARRIEDGAGIEAFRKEFNAVVAKHGWTGWKGEGSQAGYAWRTRVIYQTNMSTSYAAGRWKQLKNPALLALRPYWRYVHSDGVMHPRPLHLAWNGMVLHHEHPFWVAHFPPNGWGCQCRVTAVDANEFEKAQAAGKTTPDRKWSEIDPTTGAPVGIDHGFDYAPGANVARSLQELIDEKLIRLDAPVGAAMYEAMRPVLQAETATFFRAFIDDVLADPVMRRRVAIVGAMDRETLDWLAEQKNLVPASAEIAVQDRLIIGKKALRHQQAGDALTADEWGMLPAILEQPLQILFDRRSGKLIYVAASGDSREVRLVVEFDYKLKRNKGETNMIVSAFKVPREAIDGEIKGGFFEVVK